MTREEKKEKVRWLMRFRILEKKIRSLDDERRHYEEMAEKVTGSITETGIHGSASRKLDDMVADIDTIERDIDAKRHEAFQTRQQISNAIEQLRDETEKHILREKFLKGEYLEFICVDLNYSYQHIRRLYNRALSHLKIR